MLALHSSIEEQLGDRGVTPQCLAHPVREAKHVLCDPQDSRDIVAHTRPWSMRDPISSLASATNRAILNGHSNACFYNGIGHCKPHVIPPST